MSLNPTLSSLSFYSYRRWRSCRWSRNAVIVTAEFVASVDNAVDAFLPVLSLVKLLSLLLTFLSTRVSLATLLLSPLLSFPHLSRLVPHLSACVSDRHFPLACYRNYTARRPRSHWRLFVCSRSRTFLFVRESGSLRYVFTLMPFCPPISRLRPP